MMAIGMRALALAVFVASLGAAQALAQNYPNRPIRLIAPFPAGGLADVLARLVGDEMSKGLGQPVIIENRAGAGGNTGADAVAKAEPDGYTLLMSSAGILTANQFLYAKMPFDPETAFAPISIVADMSMLVVVNPQGRGEDAGGVRGARPQRSPTRSISVRPASAPPATSGSRCSCTRPASSSRMCRIVAPRLRSTICSAGQIDGVVDNPPTVLPHIKAGKLRPLAVAAKQRLALLPDVPTAAEAGVKNFEASSWFGIMAPGGHAARRHRSASTARSPRRCASP